MKIGDLVKLERRKARDLKDRPDWIGLVVDIYETKQLFDRGDATSEWRDCTGVIIHWSHTATSECYDESHWGMLEVINESR